MNDKPEGKKLPDWAEGLTRGLDDLIRVPGTKLGIGLDGIIGFLIPGAGDAITGVGSISLLLLALNRRVPAVIVLRMIANLLIDLLLGLVPFLGDAFDIVWKANRANLELIQKYQGDPNAKPSAIDYLVVGAGIALSLVIIVMPLVVLALYATVIVKLASWVMGGG